MNFFLALEICVYLLATMARGLLILLIFTKNYIWIGEFSLLISLF
jgi:hypothetical protein